MHFAELDGLKQKVTIGISGEEHAPDVRESRSGEREQLDAGHRLHALVGHKNADFFARLQELDRSRPARRRKHGEFFVERSAKEVEVGAFVVDVKNGRSHDQRHLSRWRTGRSRLSAALEDRPRKGTTKHELAFA